VSDPQVPPAVEPPVVSAPAPLRDSSDWLDLLAQLGLRGPLRELAANAAFVGYANAVLSLHLPESLEHFRNDRLVRQLSEAVGTAVGGALRIEFVARLPQVGETLHDRTRRERSQRQNEAEAAFLCDPAVQRLVGQYGAQVQNESIRPLEDS
jgi:DNA polymerase-3 subunit gamma/tau